MIVYAKLFLLENFIKYKHIKLQTNLVDKKKDCSYFLCLEYS